jgi:hypothetical protein
VRRLAGGLATAAIALVATGPGAAASTPRRVLLITIPSRLATWPASVSLERLRSFPQLDSIGLMTASVGSYNEQQTLLDITQGARVPGVDYSPQAPPVLTLSPGGVVRNWDAVLRRAQSANASLEPGLLASHVPGGAAYATTGTSPGLDAALAAASNGRVAAVSLGSSASLERRVGALVARHALVVVDLPATTTGLAQLRDLLAHRGAGELILALERPPPTPARSAHAPLLLALAAAGLARRPGALTTATTRIDGLVTATDLAPTVLSWLGRGAPSELTGQPIDAGPPRSLAWFAGFGGRLRVIATRRTTVLLAFLAAWGALIAAAVIARRGLRASLRLGALTALWAPGTALIGAALEPALFTEMVLVVAGAFLLAAATDILLPWPRAAALPVAVTLAVYTIDLVCGSLLIETSLLGSNPIAGSRFFGIGNELSALLPVALFAGLAAGLPQRRLTGREIALFACAGAALTLVAAWGRLGANVGAIFTIGGGTAVATLLLAPGRLSWRRVGLAMLALLVALGIVSLLDLATGGGAHYTRAVLHAHSLASLLATLSRRLYEAWEALFSGEVLIAALACLAGAALAVRHRARVLAPAGRANAWGAALGGGLGGSVLGSIANDSGPRVLLVGCFMLLCVLGYLWGAPTAGAAEARRKPLLHAFLSDA